MESAFDQKKKDKKWHLLVNNLFNIFCNVKMVFNIYYQKQGTAGIEKKSRFF